MVMRLIFALVTVLSLPAHAFETQASSAWVYDVTTKTVLMDKNADMSRCRPPRCRS